MKKLLFLVMLAIASFQLHAEDLSTVNYIEKYGRLQINNLQLCAADGTPVQLKGWSTFGLQWNTSCYGYSAFEQMHAWGANIVRLAMYIYEGGAKTDMDGFIDKVIQYMSDTKRIGMYCLVDYHVLDPGDPKWYLNSEMPNGKGAEYFFDRISATVRDSSFKHVLYEICNEPNNEKSGEGKNSGSCNWNSIKEYAGKVIPHITTNDPNAIIICGTPRYDQEIDQAVNSPLSTSANVMYAFHYYACTHQNLLSKMKTACKSIPVFVSEWGPVAADGDGDFCESSANLLMAACDGNNEGSKLISWCCWNWGDKHEASSALNSCPNWSNLTPVGEYTKGKLCQGSDCKTIIKTEGPFNSAQKIPCDLFEVAYYDLGGEGVAYHDGDGTAFECAGKGLTEDGEGNPISIDCNSFNNPCNCNAGYKYAEAKWNFRDGECVDVSGCFGVAMNYASYNLNTRENDEWLLYTVNVAEPGYYTFEYQANPATSGTVDFSVQKDGVSFGNAVYNYQTEQPFTGTLTFDNYTDCPGDEDHSAQGCRPCDWLCWEWEKILPSKDKNPAILFKEAGILQLQMSFPTEGGDLGPMRFTKVKDYTGEGYVNVPEAKATANFSIYPNPTTGAFNVVLSDAKEAVVTVSNLSNQVVYSAEINGSAEINTNLATGIYVVTVKTANAISVQKLIVR